MIAVAYERCHSHTALTSGKRSIRVRSQNPLLDYYAFLGNCIPTPPQCQHFALSEK